MIAAGATAVLMRGQPAALTRLTHLWYLEAGACSSCVVAPAEKPVMLYSLGEQFEASIVWMTDGPMLRGCSYLMRVGTNTVR
jgi:hypothetical protein